jgi:mono/diheme cytochrome c family protein
VSDPLNGFFTTKRDAGERQEFDQRLHAMGNNSTLRLADPRNRLVAMLDGIGSENFPHRESMQKMPGFSDKLSDTEAATLANYLRVTWAGRKTT